MDFIYRLLPFIRKEYFSENILTSIWIVFIIVIFIIAIWYLLHHKSKVKKSLEISKLPKDLKLKELWRAYENTFTDFGPQRKTTESAESYFYEQSVLYASFDFRSVSNISNILVGLGILGTFVGLTYGISDSSFETTEEIKSSIDNLLKGMGTAFITSIWGMGLSLIYGFVLKLQHSSISKNIQALCVDLDKIYKVSQEELNDYNESKQKKIINEIFNEYLVAETEDGRQLPKNVFRQLLDESVSQTTSLRTLSDDLSETIELAMQKLIVDNNEQISVLIQDKLVPVLEDLKQIKQDSGTEVVEKAIDRLSDSMQVMMDKLRETISADTEKEIEELTTRLVTVSESLTELPNLMRTTTIEITEVVEKLKDSVLININESQVRAQEINKQSHLALQESTSNYKLSVESMQNRMEQLLTQQSDNIGYFSSLTQEIGTTLKENNRVNQQFDELLDKHTRVVSLINEISSRFDTSAATLSQTSNVLQASISKFDDSMNTYMIENKNLLSDHKDILNAASSTVEEYSRKFSVIQEGLTGIFTQIQEGLEGYRNTTQESLNAYLSGFTTSLTDVTQGLENAVIGLAEINDELNEQIEKLVGN